ncbi:uncharacterized protein LOC134842916 [Symsagittifera roscoffensis]|uniref:uncharacterized protein LOC134842916 n=1 Tax=Symsagittifera roscoffensis TaxID=84072 RepID=UPI00307BF86F
MDGIELANYLESFTEKSNVFLDDARQLYQTSACNDSIGRFGSAMYSIMLCYVKLFEHVGAESAEKFKNILAKHFRTSAVQEAYEELLQFEDNLDTFVGLIDGKFCRNVASNDAKVETGGIMDPTLSVTHVESDQAVSVGDIYSEKPFTLFVLLRHFA